MGTAPRTPSTPVPLPHPTSARMPLTAEQGIALYANLKDLDRRQRVSAHRGEPVDLDRRCRTQTALLLLESHTTGGGEISAPMVNLLCELGVAVHSSTRLSA